jgi:hypothetical protein
MGGIYPEKRMATKKLMIKICEKVSLCFLRNSKIHASVHTLVVSVLSTLLPFKTAFRFSINNFQ